MATKLTYAGKSMELATEKVKVHREPGAQDFFVEVPGADGSLVIDSKTLARINAIIGQPSPSQMPRRRWHGWDLSISFADGYQTTQDRVFSGPVLGIGFFTDINHVPYLVCETVRAITASGAPQGELFFVNLPLFFAHGGCIMPASYIGMNKVCKGWLAGFVTHGVDMFDFTHALNTVRNSNLTSLRSGDMATLDARVIGVGRREDVDQFPATRGPDGHAPFLDSMILRTVLGPCDLASAFARVALPPGGRSTTHLINHGVSGE